MAARVENSCNKNHYDIAQDNQKDYSIEVVLFFMDLFVSVLVLMSVLIFRVAQMPMQTVDISAENAESGQ